LHEPGRRPFINFRICEDVVAEVMRITAHGAHGVIVTAASGEGYTTTPLILRPAGTMVCVGIPNDPTVIAGAPPIVIVLRKLNVVGTVVGTLKDAEEALDFTARGLVYSIFKKGTLENLDSFCELIQTGNWLDERSSRLLFDNQALLSRSGSLYLAPRRTCLQRL